MRNTPLIFLSAVGFILVVTRAGFAQTPTQITACGTYGGDLVLAQDIATTSGNCLVLESGASLDGGGHFINVTGGGYAIWLYNRNHVEATNFNTNAGIYISCDSGVNANSISITNSTFASVQAYHVDDVTIDHCTMNSAVFSAEDYDPILRTRFTNNTVTGDSHTLVNFMGYDAHPCPATNFVVTGNALTSNYTCSTCDEPKALFMRCGSGNTVSGNTVRSTGQAMPVRFRDEFDGSTVSDNTFWASNVVTGAFGAVNLTSGAVDMHYPRNNIFTRNVIRADQDVALFNQGEGTGNTFSYNTIWGASSESVANVADAGVAGTNTYDHNTFYNAGSGAAVNFSYRAATVDTFTNNIFAAGTAGVYAFDGWSFDQYVGDHNLFFNRTGTVSFSFYAPTLAAWKTNAAPDDSASIEADPLFTNASGGDFTLQPSSPAIDAAADGSDLGAYATTAAASCTENWSCGDWSECVDGTQSRTCTDLNSCGTTVNQPALSQSCETTTACEENWECGDWSECVDGSQSRTCNDTNDCGTTLNQPPLSQSCDSAATPDSDSDGGTDAATLTPNVTMTNPLACNTVGCLVSQVIRYILGALAILATLVFMWGGGMMLSSGGNPDQVKRAKETMMWAAIGIVVMITSWAVVRFIISGLLGID